MTSSLQTPCEPAAAAAERPGEAAYPGWTLAACVLASSLAFIDGSVVNVSLPTIGRELHADAAHLQWTISAYLLPLSALLLVGGALGDQLGRRRMLIGGVTVFALASLGCALAPSLAVLLAARAIQGIGAAMLMPNSLGTLGAAFSGEAKGRAVGTWASAGAIASAIGPPLGGWLVQAVGWRAIFYINLPIAAAAILIAIMRVGESARGEQPLDLGGAALATLGLGALTWGLTLWSSAHAANSRVWLGLAVAAVALALFLLLERRLGDRAMMPLKLFGSRAFVGLTLYTGLLYGALGGLILLLPYLLIVGGGYSALQAGASLLPFSLVVGTASRLTGQLTARIGPRWPLTIGPSVVAIGFALFARADPHASYWTSVFPPMLAIALGMACAVAPLTTAVLSSVDDRHAGTASGFNSAIARGGGLIATALAGAVIAQPPDGVAGAFHAAALVGAGLAGAAALSAFLTLASTPPDSR